MMMCNSISWRNQYWHDDILVKQRINVNNTSRNEQCKNNAQNTLD
jgi:hypothetical protein